MTTIQLFQQERESEYIDAEVVYEPALEGGAIVKGFLVAGRVVEAIVSRIRRMLRWTWRNLRSFGFWLRELAENAHFKFQMRRIARKGRERKQRQPINFAVFDYIREGAAAKVPVFVAWLFHVDGKSELEQDKFECEHRFEQARSTLEEDAFKKHKAARKVKRASRREHNTALAYRFVPIGVAVAGEWYYRPNIPAGPVVVLSAVLVAIGALYFGVVGRRIVRARAGEIHGFVPSPNKVDAPHLERAFAHIGIDGAKCCAPGPIENSDKSGWKATIQLTPAKTADDHVLPKRRALASAIGGLDESQLILTKAGSEDRVLVEVAYLKPSERKQGASPYTSGEITSIFKPIIWGEDAVGKRATVTLEQALLILGASTYGKSAGVWNSAAAALLDPTVDVWLCALKASADFKRLADACKVRIIGNGESDDQAKVQALKMILELRNEAHRRANFITSIGESEVTPELAQRYPELRPIVCIIDEGHFALGREQGGDEAKQLLLGIVQSYRHTGIHPVFITQTLNHAAIDANFASVFIRRISYLLGSNHENTTMNGNEAKRLGFDATELERGEVVIKGEPGGLQRCRSYFWTAEQKEALVRRGIELRGGHVEELRFDTTTPSSEPEGPSSSGFIADILAVRDRGTFGTIGVWGSEFPELCELLGITVDEFKQALSVLNIGISTQIAKNGANKRGFRFDHIKQSKEQS